MCAECGFALVLHVQNFDDSLINGEVCFTAEPISKLFEEHGTAGELHKPEEMGGVVFPADQYAPLPSEPGEEAFDQPAASIATELAAILGERSDPV